MKRKEPNNFRSKIPGETGLEKKRLIQQMLKKHPNMASLADALGVSKEAIRYWIVKLDIPYEKDKRRVRYNRKKVEEEREKKRKRKRKDFKRALTLLEKGSSLNAIGKILYEKEYPGRTRRFYGTKARKLLDLFEQETGPLEIRPLYYVSGRRLRELRLKRGLKQADLDWQCMVSKYEKEGMMITRRKLLQWAKKLKVEPDYLLGRTSY